ncbi:gliding motility-associated C-terminal domain-containing protein [bacterium AH-315-M05]|nr:gliding motility-associated C-terminal domain-containing protein [bacterium AH-315-M05]
MKHIISILIILNFCILHSKAQITFQKTFAANGMNGGLFVQKTTDGGYIVTGQHETTGAGACDIYIFKRDNCGNIEWFKTYGGVNSDGGMCIQQTPGGGYIVTGLLDMGAGGYDNFLMKIDANGNVLWTKNYGGAGDDRGLYLQQTSDGGYIVAGNTTSFGAGGWDAYVIKADANGDTLWTRTFGGTGEDHSCYVEQTSDGGYFVTGNTGSFGAGGQDVWLLKLDSSGTLLWANTYGGTGTEGQHWDTKGQITPDGGFIISSHTTSFGAGLADVWLIRTDSTGNVLWSKTYGGADNDLSRFMRQTTDQGFIIGGETWSFGSGGRDVYLIKTDSIGNLEWSRTFGGTGDDKAMGIQQANDGGYVLSGNTGSFGAIVFDVYILKTDTNGNIPCNQTNPATIVNTVSPVVNSITPTISSGAIVNNVSPVVNTFTPSDYFLCLDCNVQFADFGSCPDQLTITFIDSSGCATSWEWDFGDGNTNTVQNPIHTYAAPGTYNVQLIAINTTYACYDTIVKQIVVNTQPTYDFSIAGFCLGDSTLFTDQSDNNVVTIVNWLWDFGDGDTSTTQNPSHLYADTGTYTVTLTATTNAGCVGTVTKNLTIYPQTVGGTMLFNSTVCLGSNNGLLMLGGYVGSIINWEYSIDGGVTWTNIPNTSDTMTYSNLTTTTMYRAIIQSGLCATETSEEATIITLDPLTVGGIVFSNATVCSGSNIGTLTLTGHTGNVLYWEYSTDGGITWTNIANTTTLQSYNNLTTTTIYRALVESGICPDSYSTPATITVDPVSVGGAVGSNTTVCSGSNNGILTLTGYAGNIMNWEFSIDGGGTWVVITNDTTTQIYNNLTTTTMYRAVVQNGTVCPSENSTAATITVDPVSAGGAVGNDSTVCSGLNNGRLTLSNYTGSILNWEFSTDTGITWINIVNTTDTLSYNNLTTITWYRAMVQSGVCPPDTSSKAVISIFPLPVADAGEDTTISLGYSVMLDGSGGEFYSWSPEIDLSDATLPNPVASPLDLITYILAIIDINGCRDTDEVTINVLVDYNLIISNLMTPNGDDYNDTWYIDNIENYPECEVSIYNRYGNLIYNTSSYKNDWFGTYNGSRLPDGTYYYVLTCPGTDKVFKGGITILSGD